MAITDLFRAKHRHSDPEVRAQAIREIEDATLLASIAREDEAATVRRTAIDRLTDPDALAAIVEAEPDTAVRDHARRRAANLWLARAAGGDPAVGHAAVEAVARLGETSALIELVKRSGPDSVRREALSRLADPRALAEVARSGAPADLRTAAIERIDDGEVLRAIAIDDTHKDVAMSALNRLSDPAALEAIASKAKVKAVRTKARRAVGGSAAPEAEVPVSDEARRIRAERIQLCQNVEALARRHEWVEAMEQIDAAEHLWRQLGPAEDPRLERRFQQACQQYRNRRKKYARQAELDARKQAPTGPVVELPVVELIDVPNVQPAAAEGSQADGHGHGRRHAHEHGHAHDHDDDQGPGDEAAREERKRLKAEEREKNLQTLERIVRDLEDIESLKKIKSAEKKLHHAQETHDALGPLPAGEKRDELQQRYQKARQALVIKLQELREADEWQRWANVPLREELVRKAEELLAAPEDAKLGDRLHQLQLEWKNLGPVPHKKGQELWDKFKAVCDQVYEKVKVERAKLAEERGVNLDRRRALAERAEALAESTDWERTAEEIKRLQHEWKAIGPVPRKQGEELWARFRGACDHFFNRRKPHLEEKLGELTANLEQKQAMVARAEALSESTEWDAAADELKRLQRQWRDIGPVPRREAQAIYDQFRAACDRFFARMDEHRNAARAERERALTELVDGIAAAAADARGGTAAAEELIPRVLELRTRVLGLDDISRELRDRLRTALADMVRAAVEAHPASFKGTELDPAQARKRKEKLLARAEELIPPPPKPTGVLTAEQIAEQLRAALSDRALGGVLSKHGGRPPGELVAELRESWARLGPVPGAEGIELERRFEDACTKALAGQR